MITLWLAQGLDAKIVSKGSGGGGGEAKARPFCERLSFYDTLGIRFSSVILVVALGHESMHL